MVFWLLLLIFVFAIFAAGIFYLTKRLHGFAVFQRMKEKNVVLSWVSALMPTLLLWVGGWLALNITASTIVILHLIVFLLLCDGVAWLLKKAVKKDFHVRYQSVTALVLTVVYLSVGWYYAHHVYQTEYQFSTDKELGRERLRIVEIADLHLGVTLDGSAFAKQMERVQQVQPDLVVIAGDFVDDDSHRQDLLTACEALGTLKTTYGVYFVYGNHDKGYYNGRDFTAQELQEILVQNHIKILEDEWVLLDDSIYVIGRKDRSDESRKDMQELTAQLDKSKYMVLADHQPNDYENEAAAEVDLVLSGHTHGGHMFPAGPIGEWIHANDRNYGTELRGKTRFVVSSGISGWAIPFKTGGAISEYVVIEITGR